MITGRKNQMRRQPYGPIAARESDENFDLPTASRTILLSSWRKFVYFNAFPIFRKNELGSAAQRALRGPPAL